MMLESVGFRKRYAHINDNVITDMSTIHAFAYDTAGNFQKVFGTDSCECEI